MLLHPGFIEYVGFARFELLVMESVATLPAHIIVLVETIPQLVAPVPANCVNKIS